MQISEQKALELNKENIDLKNLVDEQSSFIWMIGQIIKHSGNIEKTEKFMEMICDIQIGVLGLKSASIFYKNKGEIKCYSMHNQNGNKFKIQPIKTFPKKIRNIKKTEILEHKNTSKVSLVTPIEDFVSGKIIGYILANHDSKNFFTNAKRNFYEILAIQIVNSIINYNLFEKVERLSNRDILTNCYNRRYLDNFTEKYKDAEHVSLVIFDIDKFKAINDLYGHNVGDIVLRRISKACIDFYSKYNGIVIRYGGDEFIIVIEKDLNEIARLTEEFRKKLLDIDFTDQMEKQPTASFGIATYPDNIDTLEHLLLVADKSLYEAKSNGRNQIISFEE